MIGYVTIGTNDLDRARGFYDVLLGEMGGKPIFENARGQFYGFAKGAMLAVMRPFDGEEACVGNGCMTALNVGGKEHVDRLYAKALELGAKDEGGPGMRTDTFYGAYFRDPDGNKLCVYAM